jgi:hypothetical protein
MANDTFTLPCAACGHQNEPERVYCHNCGQKLDRALLPKGNEVAVESDAKRRRRVQRMMRPRRPIGAVIKTLISVLIFAALVAATFLYFQQPENVPDAKGLIPDRQASDLWQALMATPQARSIELTEEEVNYFLKNALKPAESSVPGVKFERAFVKFGQGTVTVSVERSAWGGLAMYSSTTYAVRNASDGVKFEPIGVHFGRLGLDPRIPSVAGLGLGGVEKALEKELKDFARLAYVEPREVITQVDGKPERRGTIKLVTKGTP